jgi:hypothetical protein
MAKSTVPGAIFIEMERSGAKLNEELALLGWLGSPPESPGEPVTMVIQEPAAEAEPCDRLKLGFMKRSEPCV